MTDVLALIDHDGIRPIGYRIVKDPRAPHLSVLDLAATRGDGVFETLSTAQGLPQALEAHLERFGRSAAMLDLPHPDADVWRAAVQDVAIHVHTDATDAEGWVKIVLSRGVEGGTTPTGWAYGSLAPDYRALRETGIRIVLLDRGFRHDVVSTSPWLLAGAKTLSYAMNRSALREAARRDADDAVFVSSDGYLLEGAVSNLLLRFGDELVTPRTDQGILAGTTQGDLYRYAASRGLTPGYRLLTPADLERADAAWLVSSVRHAAPVRAVDGVERAIDSELHPSHEQTTFALVPSDIRGESCPGNAKVPRF